MSHLTEPELLDLLDPSIGSTTSITPAAHLAACSLCRAELDHLRASISLLRSATTAYAAAYAPDHAPDHTPDLTPAPLPVRQTVPAMKPTRAAGPSLFHLRRAPASWAAAAVVLIAASAGMANLHRQPQPAPPSAQASTEQASTEQAANVAPTTPGLSDEALLQSISDEIDQPVPTSLSVLADPTAGRNANSSSSQAVPVERTK